jgi:hypothetical protein
MSYAALQFLFWRVFMRITYTCPPHLTVRLKTHIWNEVVDRSREAIEWLAQNDEALDTLFIYAYTATSCALVQYHTWARRRDPSALDALRLVKEVALKWETTVQPDQMSIRRKTCETMTLLYEAALKTNPESAVDKMDRPLDINPTAGVSTRDAFGRAVYVKEVRRPNGGVWVALTEDDREASGIPREECILASEYDGQIPVDRGNKEDAHDQLGQTHAAPLPQAFQDMQNATNVNPQMNFGEFASEVQQPGIDFSNVSRS